MFKIAACGLLQTRQGVLHQEHRAAQVHLVRLGPGVDGHLSERLCEGVGGVVDHYIDAAELVDGALYQGGKIVDVTEVSGHPDNLSSEFAQVLSRLLAGAGFAAGDHDAGASQNEALGQRQPDSSGAARHDDGPAGHVEEVLKGFAIHAAHSSLEARPFTAGEAGPVPYCCGTRSGSRVSRDRPQTRPFRDGSMTPLSRTDQDLTPRTARRFERAGR
jgi:hypothetical protein